MAQREPSKQVTPSHTGDKPTTVLFVCLGNICRSPLAEGILEHLLERAGANGGWHVQSAGTAAYHVGEKADPRSCAVAIENGITLSGVARKLRPADFHDFDYIIGMDRQNVADIEALREDSWGQGVGKARVLLLRDFDPDANPDADEDRDVPDPYYGGDGGFQKVFEMVHRSCVAFLEEVQG